MGVLDMVIKNLVETNYQSLPTDAVKEAKKQILDMLGVIVAGSTCNISDEINGLVDLVKEWGGRKESTILAFGGQVPAPNAAFVNGILCVRRDFDDTNLKYGGGHTSRAIVPTAFAMAERQGNINGKKFITAAVLGHDLECRIAAGGGGTGPWWGGTMENKITNFFGAAATAGKILDLNDDKLRYTLAFAFHQICGAGGGGGSAGLGSLKGVSNGLAAKAAIVSALLTERGFAADWDFLEPKNRHNFYEWFHYGVYQPVILTLDLGRMFMGSSTSQKEYPCCHGQHAAIKATLGLLRENNIKPDNVAEVTLRLNPSNYLVLADPVEKKQDPQNIIEAQFSLCWGVASAIVYGEVGIRNFTEEALRDTRVREMAHKIFGKPERDLAIGPGLLPSIPSIVELSTKDGMVYSRRVDQLFGSPESPMSFTDVAAKFRHCCQYSVKPIPKENQDKVIQMVEGIEEVSDVGEIVRLLA